MASIPWDKIQSGASYVAEAIGLTINGFVDKLDWQLLGRTIGEGINTAFIFVDKFLTTVNWKNIGSSIGTALMSAIEDIDWILVGKTIKDFLIGAFDLVTGFVEEIDIDTILGAFIDLFEGLDYGAIASKYFEMLGTAFGKSMELIGTTLSGVFDSIYEYFADSVEDCGGNIVQGIWDGISKAMNDVASWIERNIFEPFIKGFKKAFGINSPSKVMSEMRRLFN